MSPSTSFRGPGIPWTTWFVGGRINLTEACVDRWADDPGAAGRPALIGESETGEVRTLTFAELHSEMADSRKLLEDRLGRPVLSASSPTGFFNPLMVPVVQDTGYRALCTGRIAIWRNPGDRFRIPRLPVKDHTGLADYRRLVAGDGRLVARMRGEQMVRNGLKSALGVDGYGRLRGWLLRRRGRKER